MVLPVTRDQQFRRFASELPCRRRRHRTAIDREEIAARRQHVHAPARRCARWAGRHESPVKRGEQPGDLGSAAGSKHRQHMRVDMFEHRAGALPASRAIRLARHQPCRQQLDALHRVAIAAPVFAGNILQDLRPWPCPRRGHVAVERIESGRAQGIQGNRTLQAGVSPLALAARHANQRRGQIDREPAGGRLPEHVQPVADLHFLQFAQPGIELGEPLVLAILGRNPISSPTPESSTRSKICFASSFSRRGSEPDAS